MHTGRKHNSDMKFEEETDAAGHGVLSTTMRDTNTPEPLPAARRHASQRTEPT